MSYPFPPAGAPSSRGTTSLTTSLPATSSQATTGAVSKKHPLPGPTAPRFRSRDPASAKEGSGEDIRSTGSAQYFYPSGPTASHYPATPPFSPALSLFSA